MRFTDEERRCHICKFLYYDAQMLNFLERMIERLELETKLREFELQMRYKYGPLWFCARNKNQRVC